MNNMGGHKLSSDFIVKNGSATAAAQAAINPNTTSPTGPSKQNYLGLMQTQPAIGAASGQQNNAKAKFKQAKPLTNNRGKSVPQERPSNSQGNVNIANAALAHGGNDHHGASAVNAGGHSATKSTTGIRISSQRQQFISSSNKTIKTLK